MGQVDSFKQLGDIVGLPHTRAMAHYVGDYFSPYNREPGNAWPQSLLILKHWCRGLIFNMTEGAEWIIPRSSFVLERRGDCFVAITPQPWNKAQEEEFRACAEAFGWAGIAVVRPDDLPST